MGVKVEKYVSVSLLSIDEEEQRLEHLLLDGEGVAIDRFRLLHDVFHRFANDSKYPVHDVYDNTKRYLQTYSPHGTYQ